MEKIDIERLVRSSDLHQSYYQMVEVGDTSIIISKLPFARFEVSVTVNGRVKQSWRGLSPFDCKNVAEEVLASVKK